MTRSAGNLIGRRLIRNERAVRWTAATVENAEGPDPDGLNLDNGIRLEALRFRPRFAALRGGAFLQKCKAIAVVRLFAVFFCLLILQMIE